MKDPRKPLNATATGTLDGGPGLILAANLCGGADAATATIRRNGAAGEVIAKLGVAAGLSVTWAPACQIPYENLHVTITGTTPQFTAYV